MSFPSFSFISRNAADSFRRFPFVILATLVAAISAIWLIELDNQGEDPYEFLHKLIPVSILGISLFTAIVVIVERWKSDIRTLLASQLLGFLLLIAYFFLLPKSLFDAPEKHVVRLALFFVETHLLVAVAPFLNKGEVNGFWQYNKALFLRLLTAVFYANVLFAGLAIALLSIDSLLGINIEGVRYAQLWVLVFMIFNTSLFLAGVPDNLDALDQKMDYPAGLKFFTQYVLIPLVTIYMIILYLYAGKIILNWSWPEGWVANLVLGFSILGILSLLLLYPVRNKVGNNWIRQFSKGYYLVLLPLVIMLLLAIWRRISEYGFTENRYFVLLAGFWLGGIALYFTLSKRKNIKVIPASLAAIVLLISFGPWGAIAVSESSQIQRLKSTLADNNILTDGQITPAADSVPTEDAIEVSAGVLYLAEVHGLDGIQPWFNEDLKSFADTSEATRHFILTRNVVEMMGLKYVDSRSNIGLEYRHFSSKPEQPIHIGKSTWLIRDQQFNSAGDKNLIGIDAHTLVLQFQPDSMLFSIGEEENRFPALIINLQSKIEELNEEFRAERGYTIPANRMTIEQENEAVRVQLLLRNINARKSGEWQLDRLNTDILLTFKKN